MKKRIIIVSIIVVLLIIISWVIVTSINNSKIIYFNNSEDSRGAVAFIETITINSNGVIEKIRITTGEKKKKQLTKQELDKLKELIRDVEDSKLFSKAEEVKLVLGNGSFKDEKYINLNKKIVIYTGNPDEITEYTNDKVEKLNKFIENLEDKYLKEE